MYPNRRYFSPRRRRGVPGVQNRQRTPRGQEEGVWTRPETGGEVGQGDTQGPLAAQSIGLTRENKALSQSSRTSTGRTTGWSKESTDGHVHRTSTRRASKPGSMALDTRRCRESLINSHRTAAPGPPRRLPQHTSGKLRKPPRSHTTIPPNPKDPPPPKAAPAVLTEQLQQPGPSAMDTTPAPPRRDYFKAQRIYTS